MLSKASLAFFPLAERKLDVKSLELSRLSEAEVAGRLGRSKACEEEADLLSLVREPAPTCPRRNLRSELQLAPVPSPFHSRILSKGIVQGFIWNCLCYTPAVRDIFSNTFQKAP